MASNMCAVSKIYDMFAEMPDEWYNHKRINLFKTMVYAAELFDAEAGNADCQDPDKAKVKERVEKIEQELEDDYKGMDHD